MDIYFTATRIININVKSSYSTEQYLRDESNVFSNAGSSITQKIQPELTLVAKDCNWLNLKSRTSEAEPAKITIIWSPLVPED